MWSNTTLRAAVLTSVVATTGCAVGVDKSGITTDTGGSATVDGVGGSGGSGEGSGSGGMANTSTGLPGACTKGEECAAMGDACNVGACINGLCGKIADASKENGPCEDGLFCTENDFCLKGSCESGPPKVCPGTDACHVSACSEAAKSCAVAPGNDGQSCPTSDICTIDATCEHGVCVAGQTRDCTVFDDLCTVGACDTQVGCKPTSKSDGTACDGGEKGTCFDSICMGGSCAKIAKQDGASCTPPGASECVVGVCMGAVCTPQPANEGGLCNDKLADPCTQGTCAAGTCKSGPAADGTMCDDALFCTVNDHCTMGVCGGKPNTCGPANGCFVFECDETKKTCTSAPGNDGAACDDDNACTAGTTCLSGVCGSGSITNEGGPCVANPCTTGDTCTAGVCGGGQVGPVIYFQDDFKDNSKGWSLGPEWQIGSAMVSTGGSLGADPGVDHTPSADNGIAGVVIGGNAAKVVHPYYYLESPAFDTSAATGSVIVAYYRWLNSDYDPFMHDTVGVFNGSQWIEIWKSSGTTAIVDSPPVGTGWTYVSFDVTPYKNAGMKVRFGFDVTNMDVFDIGSWNIDDVMVASAACP